MERKSWIILFLLLTLCLNFLMAEEVARADIYRQGSNRKELLFLFESRVEREGEREILTHSYYTAGGDLFAQERIENNVAEDDYHYTVSFLPWNETARLEYTRGEMVIFFEREGTIKPKEIAKRDDLIFGPTQQRFITDDLNALLRVKNKVPSSRTGIHNHGGFQLS